MSAALIEPSPPLAVIKQLGRLNPTDAATVRIVDLGNGVGDWPSSISGLFRDLSFRFSGMKLETGFPPSGTGHPRVRE